MIRKVILVKVENDEALVFQKYIDVVREGNTFKLLNGDMDDVLLEDEDHDIIKALEEPFYDNGTYDVMIVSSLWLNNETGKRDVLEKYIQPTVEFNDIILDKADDTVETYNDFMYALFLNDHIHSSLNIIIDGKGFALKDSTIDDMMVGLHFDKLVQSKSMRLILWKNSIVTELE